MRHLPQRVRVSAAGEINEERSALKALRGDFRSLADPMSGTSDGGVQQALQAARR